MDTEHLSILDAFPTLLFVVESFITTFNTAERTIFTLDFQVALPDWTV